MAPLPDTDRGISPFKHVVAGIWIGPMTAHLAAGSFGSCLSLGATGGTENNRIHHRHIPLAYPTPEPEPLAAATEWVMDQVRSGRTVLVRSELGRQRPALVAGRVILLMGARLQDACVCLDVADPGGLNPHFSDQLAAYDRELNAPRPRDPKGRIRGH